ncbi:MAG: DUF255 domain-containing protein [Ignavibacteriales bacterium]|nr:DUF255 domain-containing protein [Ignavibacteriales bacterium]
MNFIVKLSLTFFLISLSVFSQSLKWYTPAEGFPSADSSGKMVLLDAYTEWCGWCKVMDTATYGKKDVIEALNKEFVCIKYNPETDGNISIAGTSYTPEEFGKVFKVSGYPATAFFTKKGEFIQTITGYIEEAEFLTKVIPFIKSGDATKINYSSQKYLSVLDEAAKSGMNASLIIAYSIIYFEVEGDLPKALAKVNEIGKDDSLSWLAEELKKFYAAPEENQPSEKAGQKINEIMETYLKN